MDMKRLKQDTADKKEYLKYYRASDKSAKTKKWAQFISDLRRKREISGTRLSRGSQDQLAGLDKGTYNDVMNKFFREKGKK